MKKFIYIISCCLVMACFGSCSFFELDNYDEPSETLRGEVVDVGTGQLMPTDQGSEGVRIRLRELSWKATKVPNNFDFLCMNSGKFQNTKLFAGHYNVRLDGPFIPLVRVNQQGDTIEDLTKYIDIKGVTDVKFDVQPFLRIEWVGEPTVANGKITASFKVTRGVSPEEFKSKIEPMGGWNDNFLNVTDVCLFISETPYVGYREGRVGNTPYTAEKKYDGNSFNSQFGQTITITSSGTILPGRTVFIRAGARINYATENIKRHNYNIAKRVDVK